MGVITCTNGSSVDEPTTDHRHRGRDRCGRSCARSTEDDAHPDRSVRPGCDPGRDRGCPDQGDHLQATRPPGRSRADLRPGDLDRGRPAAPRPALLPADARGHRGGHATTSICSSTATSRATSGDVPDRSRGEGRGRRRGPPGGRRDRQRDRLRQQGPVPPSCARRASRSWRTTASSSSGPASSASASSSRTAKISSISTIARWPSSTGGRLRRRQRHRGPLQRRALLRRDVPGRRADRRPAPVGLPRSWRHHGGARPTTGASPLLPARRPAGAADGAFKRPTTVLWNVPGHRPPPDQRRHRAGARRRRPTRIHIVNPYISNRAILERLLAGGPARGQGPPHRPGQADAAVPGGRLPALYRG